MTISRLTICVIVLAICHLDARLIGFFGNSSLANDFTCEGTNASASPIGGMASVSQANVIVVVASGQGIITSNALSVC